jgi:hypothetical protein
VASASGGFSWSRRDSVAHQENEKKVQEAARQAGQHLKQRQHARLRPNVRQRHHVRRRQHDKQRHHGRQRQHVELLMTHLFERGEPSFSIMERLWMQR